jgi:hypothetical protein
MEIWRANIRDNARTQRCALSGRLSGRLSACSVLAQCLLSACSVLVSVLAQCLLSARLSARSVLVSVLVPVGAQWCSGRYPALNRLLSGPQPVVIRPRTGSFPRFL